MNTAPRVAIVTGASRGIGRAIAEQLGRQAYRVIVNYRSNQSAAQAVVDAIIAAGGEAVAVAADIGNLEDHAGLVAAAMSRWGTIDVLINNAGITSPSRLDLLQATPENWDQVLAVNLRGPFFLAQRVAQHMLQLAAPHLRYLINISSISAYTTSVNRGDYCVAKAGLSMVTKLFADRLANEQILVYEVSPGIIASDMTAPVRAQYDQRIADGLTPIRRWGTPHDVALAVESIVLGHFPFTTGQCLHVDGGFHLRRL